MNNLKINKEEIYCKVYVDTSLEEETLANFLVNHLGGIKENPVTVYNNYLHIFIEGNDEYDEQLKITKQGGFLYFRYFLEVYSQKGVDLNTYIRKLKDLIDVLRKNGFKVIPVGDFDDYSTQGQDLHDYLNDGKHYTEFM